MLGDDFYADRLNAEAREIYSCLLAEFLAGHISQEYVFRLSSNPSQNILEECERAVMALSKDHPEFFFLTPKKRYLVSRYGRNIFFRGLIAYSKEQIRRIRRLLDRELAMLTEGTTREDEWERERMIYERVASRYRYKNHDERHDYNIVGLLLRREGVCSAYANILILALRKAGIACHRVSGGKHAWTMVYINGIPLHCDVTWESHAGGSSLSYTYFNLTTEEILWDHALPAYPLPQCRFRGYGFHRKNGCYFPSARAAVKHIRSSLWKGRRVVRIKVSQEESIQKIVENGIRQMPFGSYRYSINEKQGTAIIQRC